MDLSNEEIKLMSTEDLQNKLALLRRQTSVKLLVSVCLLIGFGFRISFGPSTWGRFPVYISIVLLLLSVISLYFAVSTFRKVMGPTRAQIWKIMADLNSR